MRMGNRYAVALVVGALLVLPATAAAVSPTTPTGAAAAKPYLDSRAGDRGQAARAGTTVAAARPSARTRQARTELRRDLGRQGVLNIDPLTGTPRQLLRTDGALSSPRGGDRADIARTSCAPTATRSASTPPTSTGSTCSAARRPRAGSRSCTTASSTAASPPSTTTCASRSTAPGACSPSPARRATTSRSPRSSRASAAPRRSRGCSANVGVERSLPVTSGPSGARRTHELQGRRLRPARALRRRRRREARLARDLPRDLDRVLRRGRRRHERRDPLPPEPGQGRRERRRLPEPSGRQRRR